MEKKKRAFRPEDFDAKNQDFTGRVRMIFRKFRPYDQ